MPEMFMSQQFLKAAVSLPKGAKVKLFKIFDLLGENPRHPSLHMKKIQGAHRADIYECRVDDFWRLIVRVGGDVGIQLVYVGAHDEAIRHGAHVHESVEPFGAPPSPDGLVNAFLAGDDAALGFLPVTGSDLPALLGD
ncbi:MAG: hypothetical protein MUE60_02710 [Candidatus Eisenbacteria bacterium]|jgi:mRNA-degrading endonuclease YafQ of YafQ-DinJ toxin-antitoxin module|nr:hypothetical protein [Candidatus Eisenbacteria bacterium]